MTGSAISALADLGAPALHDYVPVARGATNKKADLFDFVLKSDLTTALTAYYTKTEVDASQGSQDTAIAARALASDVATSLALKAPLASPTLTGNPLAPTQADNDNSTKIATTAFVHSLITALIGTAPGTLDTLQEIAAALTADESTASALATTVATKLAKASNLSDLADIPTARGNLGLGTAALVAVTSLLTAANNLSDLTNVATAQTNLSVYSKAAADAKYALIGASYTKAEADARFAPISVTGTPTALGATTFRQRRRYSVSWGDASIVAAAGVDAGTGSPDFYLETAGTTSGAASSGFTTAGIAAASLSGEYRAIRLDTGTTATGSSFFAFDRWYELGTSACELNTSCALTTLSTGTERFDLIAGISSGIAAMSAMATFIGFYYRDDVNGGKWQAKVRSAVTPTETNVDTGVTVALNTLYRLRVIVNAARTEAKFYINDALVATISTNLPAAASAMSITNGIKKTVGTTSRSAYFGATEFIPDTSFWRPYA
jgi:hypothetical protein